MKFPTAVNLVMPALNKGGTLQAFYLPLNKISTFLFRSNLYSVLIYNAAPLS
jgi:hypothetical protein